MVYLESHSTDPYFNLALEEYVFDYMDKRKQYFMLWQNDNTIVVGKHQNTVEEVNQQYADAHGIKVARRLSGGGAVYHDKGNLNFTFITDQNNVPNFHFEIFVIPVINALQKIGVLAEFNGRNDITIDGLKFSGNSQYAKNGRVLHHGCIMLDSNLACVADALRVKDIKYTSKSTKSVRSRVTTINTHAPKPVTMEQFKLLLKDQIFQTSDPEIVTLTEAQLTEIRELRDRKYATWEWNYGKSPDYEVKKEIKFPAGLVTAAFSTKKGHIRSIRFFGDFFGNGDLSELEAALTGTALDHTLEHRLEALNIEHYMNGISAQELYQLFIC